MSRSRGSVTQAAITSWRIASELRGRCQPSAVMKSVITITSEGFRINRPASVSARPRFVDEAGSCASLSTRAIRRSSAVRPDRGGTIARTRSSKSSAPTRLPRAINSWPTAAANSRPSCRFRQRAVPQSSDRVTSISIQASRPRSGNDSRTYGRSERAVMFHSMLRGSSPAWYSRTSLYSMPTPRNRDCSSPPGWKPSRRSTGQRARRISSSTGTVPPGALGSNPGPEVEPRWRETVEHAPDDGLGADPGGDPLVGEHQPVAQYLGRDLTQVMRQDVGAAAHERERPTGGHQVDRRPRAGAVGDGGGQVLETLDLPGPARIGQRGRVGPHRRVDVNLGNGLLHLAQLIQGHDLPQFDLRTGDALDHHHLVLEGGVVDQHLEHEAVELRFRQRIGAVGFDRVLSGEDDEGLGKLVGVLADGDLALLHGFQ